MMPSYVRASRQALAISFMTLTACASPQFTTLTVYESPQSFVRLEVDRTLDREARWNHPVSLSPDQMVALLSGVVFQEPVAKLPLYDDFSQPRSHSALTESEIALLAPLLAIALKKASPDEIVTFYHSTARSATHRLVTSGGLFVEGDNLHLLLANYRSPTHFNADSGVVDTMDERLTPLRSIAPQRGRLAFEPASWVATPTEETLPEWLRPKRLEIVVKYQLVQPHPSSQSPLATTP
ncbi:MAG: hypothetical protein U0223_04665 [Nitrospira sp.]|nr:hypothetical protein [Nitrospira sp.]